MPVTRIGVIGMLLLALASIAGSALAASADHRQDQALANRLVFRLSDMPTGWRVEPPSKSSGPTCKAIKSVKSIETAKAQTQFSKGQIALVGSLAGVLPTVALSKRTYQNIATNAQSCVRSDFHEWDSPSVGVMSFPHVGDQSKAWEIQGKVQGVNLYGDLILVRNRRALALYMFAGVGSGNTALEVRLVRKATARA